jgi:hypothetical protein
MVAWILGLAYSLFALHPKSLIWLLLATIHLTLDPTQAKNGIETAFCANFTLDFKCVPPWWPGF